MAGSHGKTGSLSVGGTQTVNLEDWQLEETGEVGSATSMGDIWATNLAGGWDFTGSAEGKSKIGLVTTDLVGSTGEGVFGMSSSGAGYTGPVIITGVTETASVDDLIALSYTFAGNSAAGITHGAATGGAPEASVDTIHGKAIDAIYTASTSFVDIQGWTVTMTVATAEFRVAHATEHGMQRLPGILSATATVTTLMQTSDLVVIPGYSAALKLYRTEATVGDGYYDGAAVCTGRSAGVNSAGIDTWTFTFAFTGTLTLKVI